jgi:hypothetical protein
MDLIGCVVVDVKTRRKGGEQSRGRGKISK